MFLNSILENKLILNNTIVEHRYCIPPGHRNTAPVFLQDTETPLLYIYLHRTREITKFWMPKMEIPVDWCLH